MRREQLGGGVTAFVTNEHTFGEDALLLADFAAPAARERVAELGTGCGIIPLRLCRFGARREAPPILACDIQPEAVDLLRLAVRESGLEAQISPAVTDWNDRAALPHGTVDCVLCNPPYFKENSGKLPQNEAVRLSRHERGDTLRQVAAAARHMLAPGGRLCLCHRPERKQDVWQALQREALFLSRLCEVRHTRDGKPWLLLIEAVNIPVSLQEEPPVISGKGETTI